MDGSYGADGRHLQVGDGGKALGEGGSESSDDTEYSYFSIYIIYTVLPHWSKELT